MRIAIDAREVLDRPTGVGRYLAAILGEWARWPDTAAHRVTLYAPGAPERAVPAVRALLGAGADGRFEYRQVPGGRGTWWEQVQLPAALRRDAVDLLFAPAYTAPLATGLPLVVAIHDLSFEAHPEWFRPREGLRRRWLVRRSAWRARRILTISGFSRAEIVDRLRIPPGRIEVIPLGVARPRPPLPPAGRQPLVLYVGSIFNRRRVPDLLESFARVAYHEPAARLVIVGENLTYPHQDLARLARLAGLADRTTFHPYLPPAELDALYARARVFVFLSEYEGFGLTPLEALAAGVPPVVLETPVAREIYGEAACYVRRGDPDQTAGAILDLLRNEDAARTLVDRAAPLFERYTWDRAARTTWAALLDAAGAGVRGRR